MGDTIPALPPAVEAERIEIEAAAGRQSYYVAGDGPPALLVHSVNAAASAYEVSPLFEHLSATRRVYAPDLPGFGFSDRSRRDYNVTLYTDAVIDLLNVIAADYGNEPVDALALSLSSEFVARAAVRHASRFRSIAFVTPTGFTAGSEKLRKPEGANREKRWLSGIVEFPLWRSALFNKLVSPRSIRYFLKRSFGSDDVDDGLVAYAEVTARQPGAEHAPFAFLSGRLFSTDIRDVYEALQMPVWLAHGTRGDFRDFRGATWTRERSNWQVDAFDAGAMPFFEQPGEFLSRLDRFLAGASG